MVAVSGVGQTAATSTTSTDAKSRTTLDYQSFLKLFVEQLKHQDPTAPLDASESLAQLATFSQVEQSVSTNSKLDSLLTAQSLSQADTLIGRTLTSAEGDVSGKVVSVQVTSEGTVATLADGQRIVAGAGVTIS
ncbi:flagellar hook assembly protein FlgD [Pseudochelatococcus contaminans]|uniref:Basal-body rod modification protein FlgD n=1 Tax=Pseudochelatococcus contaminans TaxID=1538103 RepID=A0A7W6EE31_9HYPH|nr:flagellar hook assembly protein FlgD [Pseudochelatococcus contaminans]MBB3808008.1 flagellar basal-body rod modification protein FlgD [Pseudochelatococcus contaminans]